MIGESESRVFMEFEPCIGVDTMSNEQGNRLLRSPRPVFVRGVTS
jgi:hypothetical protein